MNSAPQIQTAEISDADLDAVAGGLAVQAGTAAGLSAGVALDAGDLLSQVGSLQTAALGAVTGLQQTATAGL
ncbi:type A2 lantipeptide [Streptomyces sp. NPDC005573]|uniref:type A2 lantipeptide n=1 Tax=unclassified Streptomyces TaxID=2593676 RepID=UPI0033AE5A67